LSNIPDDLRYTREHEWIRLEDGVGVLGITDYAQGELGDIIFVEMPDAGVRVASGDPFGTVEAVKTVEEFYSPVDCEVLEINDGLEAEPEKVNQDPYGEGWLLKIRVDDPQQLDELLDAAAYQKLIGE